MKEIKLPSGAILKIGTTPFSVSKALYQAILEEMKGISLSSELQLNEIIKNIFCVGFSSKKIETALQECLKRCTYNAGNGDLKIEESVFEPLEAREDYSLVCVEVTVENIRPFMKGLFAGFKLVSAMLPNVPS